MSGGRYDLQAVRSGFLGTGDTLIIWYLTLVVVYMDMFTLNHFIILYNYNLCNLMFISKMLECWVYSINKLE